MAPTPESGVVLAENHPDSRVRSRTGRKSSRLQSQESYWPKIIPTLESGVMVAEKLARTPESGVVLQIQSWWLDRWKEYLHIIFYHDLSQIIDIPCNFAPFGWVQTVNLHGYIFQRCLVGQSCRVKGWDSWKVQLESRLQSRSDLACLA